MKAHVIGIWVKDDASVEVAFGYPYRELLGAYEFFRTDKFKEHKHICFKKVKSITVRDRGKIDIFLDTNFETRIMEAFKKVLEYAEKAYAKEKALDEGLDEATLKRKRSLEKVESIKDYMDDYLKDSPIMLQFFE